MRLIRFLRCLILLACYLKPANKFRIWEFWWQIKNRKIVGPRTEDLDTPWTKSFSDLDLFIDLRFYRFSIPFVLFKASIYFGLLKVAIHTRCCQTVPYLSIGKIRQCLTLVEEINITPANIQYLEYSWRFNHPGSDQVQKCFQVDLNANPTSYERASISMKKKRWKVNIGFHWSANCTLK